MPKLHNAHVRFWTINLNYSSLACHNFGGHTGDGHAVGSHNIGSHAVGGHKIGGHAVGGHKIGGHAVGGRRVAVHCVLPTNIIKEKYF